MSLRIGFDMDGVLADFRTAFQDIETRLFGHRTGQAPDQPEEEEERPERQLAETRRRRDQIWDEIRKTPDFWTTLRPLGNGSVRRIHALMLAHNWEVFFITQRPSTAVRRCSGRRSAGSSSRVSTCRACSRSAARAEPPPASFRLDYHVDDTIQHCLDVIADSNAKAILVASHATENSIIGARKLGIAIAGGVDQALDILERATLAQENPTLLRGWLRWSAGNKWGGDGGTEGTDKLQPEKRRHGGLDLD